MIIGKSIMEVDLHGCNIHQAQIAIDAALKRSKGAYRIRLIHGYTRGHALKDMIRQRYTHHPSVIRLEYGMNQGETDLILRELF